NNAKRRVDAAVRTAVRPTYISRAQRPGGPLETARPAGQEPGTPGRFTHLMPESDPPPARPAETLLRCERLVVGYRGHGLFPPLDLTLRRGDFVLVVGRNGAGKSTWLRSALGLLRPVSGHVYSPLGRDLKLSYVPQHAALDELLPVRARSVVGWGRLRGWDFLRPLARAADRRAESEALAEANAGDFAGQSFRSLSGGQRQRVLFARLLASQSDIAMLDEPTASMDVNSERRTYRRLEHLAREHDMAIVVVTHTIDAAAHSADRVLFIDRGDGADGDYPDGVAEFGPPHAVFAHDLFQRHFGDVASVSAIVAARASDELTGECQRQSGHSGEPAPLRPDAPTGDGQSDGAAP
ncbi:MAG: metal ABC transporter ATP-binding protein, partial [Myxococcota bacterium]